MPVLMPINEEERVAALREYGIVDAPPNATFDRLVRLAGHVFNVPIALISFIDSEKQYIQTQMGMNGRDIPREIPRDISFCAHTIAQDDVYFIPDTIQEQAFKYNPTVVAPPYIRFYAGIALRTPTGEAIGSLAVLDHLPHLKFSDADRQNLRDIGCLVTNAMETSRLDHARTKGRTAFTSAAATSCYAVVCVDGDGDICFTNPPGRALFEGHDRMAGMEAIVPDLSRKAVANWTDNTDRTVTHRVYCGDGTQFEAEIDIFARDHGGWSFVIRDLGRYEAIEHRLARLASIDVVTGLPNKAAWHNALAGFVSSEEQLTMLMLDLDGFKDITQARDPLMVDAVLKTVAARLAATCPAALIISRLEGDTFAVLLRGDDLRIAHRTANDAIAAISAPMLYEEELIELEVSVGISLHPPHGTDAEDLMAAADLALHQAKISDRGTSVIFTTEFDDGARLRRNFEEELRQAFDRGELELYYQPQISMRDRSLKGAEALLRWHHPTRGLLMPGTFINVLGKMPLSSQIGEWILNTACQEAVKWTALNPDFQIAVNLFSSQFRAGSLLASIRHALKSTGLSPKNLEVEIVENILTTQDGVMAKTLHDLRSMGVGLAFDDYGTGFAALSVLKRYPASRLKIDQSFVCNAHEDAENAAVVKVIVYLAKVFGMDTIAEGVETEEQFDFLRRLGCLQAQGYLFGQPVPAQTFFETYILEDKKI